MSDNQRRAVCRILFLVICVFPTSAIGYWICHPQTATGWEESIQAHLGVTTEIDSVETPGPYVTILRGLKFLDNDGKTIMKTVTARIEYGSELNRIVIPNKVHGLTNDGLAFLIHSIDQKVIRNRSVKKRWTIEFEQNATIQQVLAAAIPALSNGTERDPPLPSLQLSASVTLSNLQIDIGPTVPSVDGTLAVANFRIANPNGNPVSDKFVYCEISKTDQRGHVMGLNTNDSPLPCWLISHSVLDLAATIGPHATFNGALHFEPGSSVNLEIAGVFENVDVATSIPLISQETASIQLNRCKFANGALDEWDAFLFPDSESSPKRIDQKDLFIFSSKIDIASAISKTYFGPEIRSANVEIESNLRQP